ncbi:hypothetical protein H5410_023844 [Solanum commersonii]|uniref:Uncharacterized protein n=1 Tax=Solanum commersonii TaxID=4109 RepID=A0A9J5ZKA3_SOLCO|nr:hypothetical protein H5410_023844 [Solanum commersonii]
MKSDCFQLIGYPPWYKGKKKEGYNVQYNVPVHNSHVPGFNPEYGGHNTGPSYGNLSLSHNYNNAGEISRFVRSNNHTEAHTHGHVGLHGSYASGSSGSNVTVDMCTHGCGNTDTHGHGGGGINMAFTDNHSISHGSPSLDTACIAEISGPSFNDNSDIFVYDDHQNSIVLPEVSDISPSLNISPDPISSSPTHFSLPLPSAVSSPNTIEPNFRRSTRSSKPPGWLHGFVHTVSSTHSHSQTFFTAHHLSTYMSYVSISPSYFRLAFFNTYIGFASFIIWKSHCSVEEKTLFLPKK